MPEEPFERVIPAPANFTLMAAHLPMETKTTSDTITNHPRQSLQDSDLASNCRLKHPIQRAAPSLIIPQPSNPFWIQIQMKRKSLWLWKGQDLSSHHPYSRPSPIPCWVECFHLVSTSIQILGIDDFNCCTACPKMLLFDAYVTKCPFLVQFCPFLVQICPFLVQMRQNSSFLDTGLLRQIN